MASSQHYQQQYEVLTHVNENTMTTRPMRVSRNRENLQPYWIPEGFRAVLISINDIQRLPLQQATQDIQQRQNENTTHRRSRHANHNQTNPMARQGRCNTATVLGATLDQITVARAISSKPKRKELSGNENDENSQKNNTPTASASASASTSIGSPMVAAQAKKRCLGNNKRIDARQLHNHQNQRAAINSRNNENKTPEHNISDPFGNYVATTTNTIAQTPSHNQRVSQRMSLSSQQAVGSSNEFKPPRKAMALERDALYAMHGSNRVSKNTSSMHINKMFRVSKVESSTVSPHHLHPFAEDNSGLSNESRNNNGDEEMESVELGRDPGYENVNNKKI